MPTLQECRSGQGTTNILERGSEPCHLVQSFVKRLYGGQKGTTKLANQVNSEHYRRPYIESFCGVFGADRDKNNKYFDLK